MPVRLLTAGESHGPALVGILEGMPAGLKIDPAAIQRELARRKLGAGRSLRQGIEADRVEIISGVRHGRTLGSPIAIRIPNEVHSDGGLSVLTVPRPGHADLAGARKYGFVDLRDVMERASARETAARTALGAVAKSFLGNCGIAVASRVIGVGSETDRSQRPCEVCRLNSRADASPVRATNPTAARRMVLAIERAARAGNTLGGVFEVWAEGLPPGLGSYVHWDRRLDGRLAGALMALNGIKAVAVGLGFEAAALPGSRALDSYSWKSGRAAYRSNRSGGIDAGVSTGEPLHLRAAMKPLPTLGRPLPSVDLASGRAAPAPVLRSDICAVPAAAVISEALIALVLAEALLEKTGGDSMRELLPRLRSLRK